MIRATGMVTIAAFLGFAFVAGAADADSYQAGCRDDLVFFPSADVAISVEVADDPGERAQGLMGRRELPAGHGMLFIYETPRPASFWMRNTLIPLDLIFFDSAGIVRHVHPDARPFDETPIPGAKPGDPDPDRLMVLEIGGGEAARLGIQAGMAIAHPALDPGTAAVMCR